MEGPGWDCITMPQVLQKAGYHATCIGKWHLGFQFYKPDGSPRPRGNTREWKMEYFAGPFTHGPNDRGFDYFFGTLSGPKSLSVTSMYFPFWMTDGYQ